MNIRPLSAAALTVLLGLGGCVTSHERVGKPVDESAAAKCSPPPLATTLYLRGSMNTWVAQDLDAFQYACDAYYLNVDITGAHEFKIVEGGGKGATTFGAPRVGTSRVGADELKAGEAYVATRGGDAIGTANLMFRFNGEHTIRLAFAAGQARITIGARSFVDPTDRPIADAVATSLHFDSRSQDPMHKWPVGAVTAGSDVGFFLVALPGVTAVSLVVEKRRLEGPQETLDYSEIARVPLKAQKDGARAGWFGNYRFDEIGVYGYYFVVEIAGKTYLYENNRDRIYWTREAGSGGLGRVEDATRKHTIRRYRQTVYRDDYRVPEWAKDAVYYYIFPERFRNGDSGNDPRPGVDKYHNGTVELHTNWLEKPYLPHSGDGSDDVYGNDFFGGDIAGIIDKLDYIADLGANTLYITPLFRAASNHKYDTADYKNIDPHFGTNEDFVRLTKEAAKRGIRVIPDTSLNHTGSDSIYFDRYDHYGDVAGGPGAFKGEKIRPDSPYADWYRFDPTQTQPDKQYRGWWGAQDLPETNKASKSFRDYAFAAPDSVMKLWLDRGAAGWRMDVAPWVPDDFWRDWRIAVKSHKADALTIAETQFDSSKYFLGDEFDSTMNYIFRNAVQDYAAGANAKAIYRNIELMRENYPPQAFYALMNLLSTHDTERALYDFGYRDADKDSAETVALAKQRLRLAVFFQMTFPGAPTVFYGDEVGVTGGNDPFNRVTYPWADLGGKPDLALLADFRKLIKLRKDMPVLRRGSIDAPVYIDDHVIVLVRRGEGQWAITATNNDSAAHSVSVKLPPDMVSSKFTDVMSGRTAQVENGTLAIEVPALFGTVLLAQGTAQANVHVLPTPLEIPGLDRQRTIRVYLPPNYEASKKRYPVLYMHDGQNLFDATTAYAGEWGVDETLNALAESQGLEVIVVGIDNGGGNRIHELTAWDNPQLGKAQGRQYMDFVVGVVKPFVDSHYRTKRERMSTAIMGSSMGGLISHYALVHYPDVFGRAGIFSPSYWMAPAVFDVAGERAFRKDAKLAFYVGGKEGDHMQTDLERMAALLRAEGHPEARMHVDISPAAPHNEAAWRAEFPQAVQWLFRD